MDWRAHVPTVWRCLEAFSPLRPCPTKYAGRMQRRWPLLSPEIARVTSKAIIWGLVALEEAVESASSARKVKMPRVRFPAARRKDDQPTSPLEVRSLIVGVAHPA